MGGQNEEVIYSADDENRIYCDICDKICIERFYKNHPKSRTHILNTHKRQQSKCKIIQISNIINVYNEYN